MTDYNAIADRIVAQGVIQSFGKPPDTRVYWMEPDIDLGAADTACHDWRVAGALMEKCRNVLSHQELWVLCSKIMTAMAFEGSLPLAIILACLEALEQ